MTKRHLLIILGIIVALAPFSGLPDDFRKPIIVVAGLVIVIASYVRNFSIKSEDSEHPVV